MKCLRCNRELTTVAVWVGGNAIGPKCAQIMGLMQTTKRTARALPKMKNDQPNQSGLFDEIENEGTPCATE